MMLLGYWDVSAAGAVGQPFKRDIGRCSLQRHPASDGQWDATRVPGLPEPANRTLAPETQEDQLREKHWDWLGERERERMTEWETI